MNIKIMKRTQSLWSNVVEVYKYVGVALLLLALNALTVCMTSCNLTTKELCQEKTYLATRVLNPVQHLWRDLKRPVGGSTLNICESWRKVVQNPRRERTSWLRGKRGRFRLLFSKACATKYEPEGVRSFAQPTSGAVCGTISDLTFYFLCVDSI